MLFLQLCSKTQMNELTEDVTYLGPLSLFLQQQSELGADVDVVHVVQQSPHHAAGQMHDAAETHELTELEREDRRSVRFYFYTFSIQK